MFAKILTYFRVAWLTTWNILLNGLSGGRFVWLEGRVRNGRFHNWAYRFRYQPPQFIQPTTEDEIIKLVKNAKKIRVFGSGHSFNPAIVSDELLLSLDQYAGVLWVDRDEKQMAVKGGTRVRDVIVALKDEGWAFEALPSHDAQSIGGILSTDVHGTGRNWGFVSQSVVALKIVDGLGEVHICQPNETLFQAAIGGIGAVGIIIEVVVQAVDRFNVEQITTISDLATVEANLEQLLADNDHVSLYAFPFTDTCQVNLWNHTKEEKSWAGSLREFLVISGDALLAAWFGNLVAYCGLLPSVSSVAHRIKKSTDLVLESNEAFNRTIYHLHQELEFSVPFVDTLNEVRRFQKLYEGLYRESRLPYMLFEVRFTPSGHNRTLIGPGQEQRCGWIDLVCNDSAGFERYYAAAEQRMKKIGARPHLGKFTQSFTSDDLLWLYGEKFTRFKQLITTHDPSGRFVNPFINRLFR
ncbi:MAG: D-arabinono-1,4-lactone oxidase [Chloroflexota bacterium]